MIDREALARLTKDNLEGSGPSRLGISLIAPQRRLDTLNLSKETVQKGFLNRGSSFLTVGSGN